MKIKYLILALSMLFIFACGNKEIPEPEAVELSRTVEWAGFRSSIYGATDPLSTNTPVYSFPEPETWDAALDNLAGSLGEETKPTCIWIIGKVDDTQSYSGKILLEMERQGNESEEIHFIGDEDANWSRGYSDHEKWLDYFDANGINVILQVEPGYSPVDELIDLVMTEWGHHPSVIGFGVDVEWYGNSSGYGGGRAKVDAETMVSWLEQIQGYLPDGLLMVKHWDTGNLGKWADIPRELREYMVFCCDAQGMGSSRDFFRYMSRFASAYEDDESTSPVWFQIGYSTDWWETPSWAAGNAPWFHTLYEPWEEGEEGIPSSHRSHLPPMLAQGLIEDANPDQEIGIIWVDFTMRNLYPQVFDSSFE